MFLVLISARTLSSELEMRLNEDGTLDAFSARQIGAS
jgi:hypothetical protein